jgi:hypothetical protein
MVIDGESYNFPDGSNVYTYNIYPATVPFPTDPNGPQVELLPAPQPYVPNPYYFPNNGGSQFQTTPSKPLTGMSAPTVGNGGTLTCSLTMINYLGQQQPWGGDSVQFTLTNPMYPIGTFGAVTDNENGTYSCTFTATNPGSNSVSAVVNGANIASSSPVTVTGGATVYQPLDPGTYLVPISNSALPFGFVLTSTQVVTAAPVGGLYGLTICLPIGATVMFVNVYPSAVPTIATNQMGPMEEIPVTAFPIPTPSGAPSPIPTKNYPTDLNKSKVTVSGTSVSHSGGTITVTLTEIDSTGNQQTVGGDLVAFCFTGLDNYIGNFGTVTDNNNGTYTCTFTASTVGVNSFSAIINGAQVNSRSQPVTSS